MHIRTPEMASRTGARSQAGFSLMELLVSMGVMTVVMGAAFLLLGRGLNFANITFQVTEAEQTLRTTHEIVNRDLTTAGDGLRGMNMIRVPVGFVQNFLTRTPVVDPGTPSYPNLGLVTSDNNVPTGTAVAQSNPSRTVLAGSDRISILSQDTSFSAVSLAAGAATYNGSNTSLVVPAADIGRFQANEIYAVVSGGSVAFAFITSVNAGANTLTLTNGDVFGINQTGPSAPIFVVTDMNVNTRASTDAASIIRLQIFHYYVSSDLLLIRRIFGVRNVPFVDSVVGEHVLGFQLRYFLNTTDTNGFVDPPVSQLSLANQTGVRQVEARITVETVRAVNNANSGNGGRQTIEATQATTVRNLQFREAL